jgi:hypothetical protein
VECRANACFHPDPARAAGCLHLAARPLLPSHNGAALILANDMERALANIDADCGQSGRFSLPSATCMRFSFDSAST